MDPQIGTYRTDALIEVAVTIAVSLYMAAKTFDVCATRLSGMSIDRSMHIRPPTLGVRAVGEHQKVRLGQLPHILKGANGHTDAAKLWYQEAREQLTGKIRLMELRCASS